MRKECRRTGGKKGGYGGGKERKDERIERKEESVKKWWESRVVVGREGCGERKDMEGVRNEMMGRKE